MKRGKYETKKIFIIFFTIIILIIASFSIYEIATRNNTYYIYEKNLQIPIFTYHKLVLDESEIKYEYMETTVETFKKQINGLMKLGYKPIDYETLVKYKNEEVAIPKWSFIITFDDGNENFYEYVYPVALEYNIPITAFIVNDTIGQDGILSWNEIKEMKNSNLISIYSHGESHLKYDEESPEKLLNDTNKAYGKINEELNNKEEIKVFAYPYGAYSEDNIKVLEEAGYIQNLMDNKINTSKNLNLSKLHRCYPLSNSVFKIILKQQYRAFRYKN